MSDFLAELGAHAAARSYQRKDRDLPFDVWKPRFKLIGKTFGWSEWIKVRAGWKEALGGALKDHHVAFLELFLTQKAPVSFKAMKDEAKRQFRIFFEAEPRPRLLVRFHALDLPAPDSDVWSITLSDGTRFGPVVVFDMCGWTIVNSTLVG
ncbi:hypothetical protein WME97_33630 [Sorangium sp. So ce367]|uniref:hypothetical protein n=1 Tax=Sorangium sp. So ce367 TaxID=3133305 RepID=UPI003F64226E